MPASRAGLRPAWPVASFRFAFAQPAPPGTPFDFALNLAGLAFPEDRESVRVLTWDGSRYQDVTTQLDLVEDKINARVSESRTLVPVSEGRSRGARDPLGQARLDSPE